MDDDIYVDIPSLRGLAEQLNAVYTRITNVITALDEAKVQLAKVWQDEVFNQFSSDYEKGIDNLLQMKVSIDAIERILNQACDEYQAADNEIMSLL